MAAGGGGAAAGAADPEGLDQPADSRRMRALRAFGTVVSDLVRDLVEVWPRLEGVLDVTLAYTDAHDTPAHRRWTHDLARRVDEHFGDLSIRRSESLLLDALEVLEAKEPDFAARTRARAKLAAATPEIRDELDTAARRLIGAALDYGIRCDAGESDLVMEAIEDTVQELLRANGGRAPTLESFDLTKVIELGQKIVDRVGEDHARGFVTNMSKSKRSERLIQAVEKFGASGDITGLARAAARPDGSTDVSELLRAAVMMAGGKS